jgi:predicted transcriptional regulator
LLWTFLLILWIIDKVILSEKSKGHSYKKCLLQVQGLSKHQRLVNKMFRNELRLHFVAEMKDTYNTHTHTPLEKVLSKVLWNLQLKNKISHVANQQFIFFIFMCPKTCPLYLSIGVCGKEKGWGRLVSLSGRTKVNPWEHDKVALGQNVLSLLLLSIFFLLIFISALCYFFLSRPTLFYYFCIF